MRMQRRLPIFAALVCSITVLPAFSQQFITPHPVAASATLSLFGAADLNRDGRSDILIQSGSFLAILLENKDGTFTQRATTIDLRKSGTFATVTIADVNGDGFPDVVVATASQEYCYHDDNGVEHCQDVSTAILDIALGNGDGTFKSMPTIDLGVDGYDRPTVLVGDFNGDGKADIVVSVGDATVGYSTVTLLNAGGGTFNLVPYNQTSRRGLLLAAGDFNGDGKLDLAVGDPPSSLSSGLYISNGVGDGTFTFGASYPSVHALMGATADFDGDGHPDLVVSQGSLPPVVLLGKGDGTFHVSQKLSSPSPRTPLTIDVADLNHDGHPDLVISYTDGPGFTAIFQNTGHGSFGNPRTYNLSTASAFVGGYGGPVSIGDFNGDGNLDLLSLNEIGGYGFTIAFGDKYGSFAAPLVTPSPNPFGPVVSGDFNGDGKPDIAQLLAPACNGCNSTVHVFPGSAKGYLNPGTAYPVDVANGILSSGDVNGDGKLDLVVARSSSSLATAASDISVLLGNGDGTFQPAISRHLLGNANSFTANYHNYLLDVNHDGKEDFIGDWGVALGNGDGTFKAPIPLPSAIKPVLDIAVGDLNKDGNPDLIVTQDGGNQSSVVYILIGDGTGAFQIASQDNLTQNLPPSALLKDFNGDGNLDLVYTGVKFLNGSYSYGLVMRLGKGDGTFAPKVFYPADFSASPGGLLAQDFNGDGNLDILQETPGFALGDFALFPGSPSGTFTAPVQHYFGYVDGAVAVDINGDGKFDVVGNTPAGITRILNTGSH